jgi:predicted metal-dependent peptidase
MELSTQDKLAKGRIAIMRHKSTMLYTGLVMVPKQVVSRLVPTAATNGQWIMYNPDFVDTLTPPEIVGLILHEVLHVTYRHFWLWKHLWKEDAKLANMAADFVINVEIMDLHRKDPSFIKLPEKGLYDEKYRGWSTEEVFRDLKREGKGGDGGDGEGDGEGFDTHDWEAAEKLTEEEVKQLQREIDNAIRQGIYLAGKGGGDKDRLVELTEPTVDWREVLPEFMCSPVRGGEESTWSRPNRRWMAQNEYRPSTYDIVMDRVLIGVDTSGSIDDRTLSMFLAEIASICRTATPKIVDLIYWDDGVASHEVYTGENYESIAQSTKIKGGGGTNPSRVAKYLQEKNITPDCIVMLTDGCISPGDWGVWSAPILWGITHKGVVAPCGESVYVG